MIVKRLRDDFWLIPLTLANLLVRAYGIADPWLRGHRGFNSALGGLVARNYLRYGLETRLAPVWASGPLTPPEMVEHFHLRHPSLRYLCTTLFTALLGPHEWAITLLPVLFSTATAVVLYFFVKRFWGKWTALLAVGFITFVPMDAYYGGMSGYESMGMFLRSSRCSCTHAGSSSAARAFPAVWSSPWVSRRSPITPASI